jgi:lipopolysaccharide transport protein LptA
MILRVFPLLLLLAVPAFAEEKQPISIEAGNQLEWLRDENKYRATKDVVITQGDTIIKGDTAEALYDPAEGPSALTVMDIDGHVSIAQGDRLIVADKAHYDTKAQEVLFTGQQVMIKTPDLSVTSNGQVRYLMAARQIISEGSTTITQKDQVLKADRMTAFLDEGNKLDRATARGNVIITRKANGGEDVVRADSADYNTTQGKIILTGNVRLARGESFMQGARATVDLKTGYSSLQNDPAQGTGRVRAIFSTSAGPQKISMPSIQAKKKTESAYQVSPNLYQAKPPMEAVP